MPHSHFLNKVIQSRKWESWPLSKICRCNKLVFGCKNVDGSSPPEDISPLAMQYSGPDNSSPCIAIYYQFIAGQVFAGNPICDASDNRQLSINLLMLIINRSASSAIILWQKTAWPKLCLGNYPTTPGPPRRGPLSPRPCQQSHLNKHCGWDSSVSLRHVRSKKLLTRNQPACVGAEDNCVKN